MVDTLFKEGFFDEVLEYDFFKLVCGERLGRGQGREVWSCAISPAHVIKLEGGAQSFQNVYEWELWHSALEADNGAHEWLAPCASISPCGRVLMQARTRPAPHKSYPDKLPAFLTDTKFSNFGMIGKRFVAHDYGMNVAHKGGVTTRLRSVHWYDEP